MGNYGNIVFYVNGNLEGEYKKFYGNGQLWLQCLYVNGKIEGEYKEFYENGQLREHYFYVNGKKVD